MPYLRNQLVPHTATAGKGSRVLNDINVQDAAFQVHPHLIPCDDPCRGRLLRLSTSVPAGTVLLIDTPYAIVPTAESLRDDLICSNLACSRRVPQGVERVSCPGVCFKNVVWCNETCRKADYARHEFECLWLKQHGETIRRKEGQYNFVTLWHVVRILAGRYLETGRLSSVPPQSFEWQKTFQRGWESIDMCCAYIDTWPDSQIKHWRRLAEMYLNEAPICLLEVDEMILLICKEETNTFGLYAGLTGPLGMIDRPVPRGESYGLSIFPTAAMFNHSCVPNVFHTPDDHGKMIYTAAREIAQGEECTIAYFDLTVQKDLEMRQKWTVEQFQFLCTCERCVEEAAEANLIASQWLPFPEL